MAVYRNPGPNVRLNFLVTKELAGQRLDHAIHEAALGKHDISKRAAKALIDDGAVTVNGRQTKRASLEMREGARVIVQLPDPKPTRDLVDLTDLVIFRDEFVLAINKPAWLATHATRDVERDHALAGVERLLRGEGKTNVRINVPHRLDVETSGVLLFGIDPRANKGLTDAFRDRLAHKTYVALTVMGEVADTWTVENHLAKDTSERRAKSVPVLSGGDHALTDFTVLKRLEDALLIRANPKTGRMHQIRTHLATSGIPILGDTLYGGPKIWRDQPVPRVLLHAQRLELPHPITGRMLRIEAPLPAEFAV